MCPHVPVGIQDPPRSDHCSVHAMVGSMKPLPTVPSGMGTRAIRHRGVHKTKVGDAFSHSGIQEFRHRAGHQTRTLALTLTLESGTRLYTKFQWYLWFVSVRGRTISVLTKYQ